VSVRTCLPIYRRPEIDCTGNTTYRLWRQFSLAVTAVPIRTLMTHFILTTRHSYAIALKSNSCGVSGMEPLLLHWPIGNMTVKILFKCHLNYRNDKIIWIHLKREMGLLYVIIKPFIRVIYEFPFFFYTHIILIRVLQSCIQVLFADQLKQEIKPFLMFNLLR